MAHEHRHAQLNHNRAFAVGVALNVLYIIFEVGAGWAAGSVALLADAGHNASDVLSLLLAWGASALGRRRPTQRRTYGLRRSTILASLANAILLLVAIGAIAWEAVRRFAEPQPVPGSTLMWVAAIGIVINTATALLFVKGRERDINIRGAFLHMAADAGVSAGVVGAGVAIHFTGLAWIDPLVSLLIVLVIAVGTWGLLRNSVNLIMDAVPPGIDPRAVETYLAGLPGVKAVHDLHIWGMSTTETALTAHVVRTDGRIDDDLLARIDQDLQKQFGIGHATVQFEGESRAACRHAPPEAL